MAKTALTLKHTFFHILQFLKSECVLLLMAGKDVETLHTNKKKEKSSCSYNTSHGTVSTREIPKVFLYISVIKNVIMRSSV
jgi:hypothetical protein